MTERIIAGAVVFTVSARPLFSGDVVSKQFIVTARHPGDWDVAEFDKQARYSFGKNLRELIQQMRDVGLVKHEAEQASS